MVHSGMFRFDFSHFAKVTSEELNAVEQFVNARIKEQIPLEENRNVPYDQAISDGAMALFGEKYGDIVRTIRFGQSIELCGGTHVETTFDIWHFKITTETAVAAGIRRIEAITGEAALQYFEDQNQLLIKVNELLKNPQDISKAVTQLQAENVSLKKELNELKKQQIQILAKEAQTEIQGRNGITFLAKAVDLDAQSAKDLAFALGKDRDDLFLVLGSAKGHKPMLSCYISKKLVSEKGMNAELVVRELGQYIQGGGGGQPFFATAGGKNSAGISKALKAAIDLIPS
jgi:alanyl-tRNA synthetase